MRHRALDAITSRALRQRVIAMLLLLKHVARGRGSNERIAICLEQKALRHRIIGRSSNGRNVSRVIPIALLKRGARITRRQSLYPRGRKWNPAARVIAHLTPMEPGRRYVPTEVRTERRFQQHHRNAADLIAVGIDAGHDLLQNFSDVRWLEGVETRIFTVIETRAPIVLEHSLQELARCLPTSRKGALGFELARMAGMSGKPIAAFVDSTRLPLPSVNLVESTKEIGRH